MSPRRRLVLCVGLIALITSVFWGTPSTAAQEMGDAPGFTFAPEPTENPAETETGYFIYELRPNGRETAFVRLTNPGTEPVTINLETVDATTAPTSGSAFSPQGVKPTAVGTWLKLTSSDITLDPGSSDTVGFRIRVPKDVAPGQYLAGITAFIPAETTADVTNQGDDNANAILSIQTRYAIAVQINVPGEWTPSLSIDAVDYIEQPSGPVLGIALHNDGDTFLKPKGTISVEDESGDVVLNQSIEMGTFLTGTAIQYPVAWPGGPAEGTFTTHVALTYGDHQTATFDGTLTIADNQSKVSVSTFDVTEVHDPTSEALQFVTVDITIDNPATAIPNARLTLLVEQDGAPVESFVLASSLTIQSGQGEINQRYFPPTGWTTGTYSFTLVIETVDPATGDAIEILSVVSPTTVVVE